MSRKETNNVASRKRGRSTRPFAALVVSAIQDLRETKGSTSKKIIGYISYASSMPEKRVKRQVKAALKRGVEYGILRRYRGHYFLPTSDELERANRIAVRFARLPTPAPLFVRSKGNSASRRTKDRRKRLGNGEQRNGKKVRKTGSDDEPSVSAVPSLTDGIASDVASVAE